MNWIKTSDKLPPKHKLLLGLAFQSIYTNGKVVFIKYIDATYENNYHGREIFDQDHWNIDGLQYPISYESLSNMIEFWCPIPADPTIKNDN